MTEPFDLKTLDGMLKAIAYEVDMIGRLVTRLRSVTESEVDGWTEANAYEESLLMHVRNLHEFLSPKQRRPDDTVTAEAYRAPGTTPSPSITIRGRAITIADIHKHAAHLSSHRVDASIQWFDENGSYSTVARWVLEPLAKWLTTKATDGLQPELLVAVIQRTQRALAACEDQSAANPLPNGPSEAPSDVSPEGTTSL